MLRILIVVLFIISPNLILAGEANQFKDPSDDVIKEQRKIVNDALIKTDDLIKSGALNESLIEERKSLSELPQVLPNYGYRLPEFFELKRTDRYLEKAFNASSLVNGADNNKPSDPPVILVSFSMNDQQIKDLISEANGIGAYVVIRGLIDDDYNKTFSKIGELTRDSKAGGVAIDPTLFDRFQVNSVPTFVLPMGSIDPCTLDGCTTPKYVKATGSTTLRYFLELVSRTGTAEQKLIAQKWVIKYAN